jgi:hypothetical protein
MKKYSGIVRVTVNLKRRKEKARLMVQRASKIWWLILVSGATSDTNTLKRVDWVQRKHGRLIPVREGQQSINEAKWDYRSCNRGTDPSTADT